MASNRRLLVSARRHSDRRVLADRPAAQRAVGSEPGRRALSGPRLAASAPAFAVLESCREIRIRERPLAKHRPSSRRPEREAAEETQETGGNAAGGVRGLP